MKEGVLYDLEGTPLLRVFPVGRIVDFGGRSLGFLHGKHIYDYNGTHRGFLTGGVVRDHAGAAVAFADRVSDRTVPLLPMKKLVPIAQLPSLEPLRPLAELAPMEPVRQFAWSQMTPMELFGL